MLTIHEQNHTAFVELGPVFQNPLWYHLSTALSVTEKFADDNGERKTHTFYWYGGPTAACVYAGLVPYVAETFKALGVPCEIRHCRTPPSSYHHYPNAAPQFEPYDDQRTMAQYMLDRTRGVLDLATNFGKTYLASWFWFQAGQPTMLLLVPTKELLHQTSADLERLAGLGRGSVGRIGDGLCSWMPITVGIINSVADWVKQRPLPLDFGALFVDEGHLQAAEQADLVASRCDAYYRFWMSGTAYRDNDPVHVMRLTALAGPLLAKITNKYLVDQGRSAVPTLNFIPYNGPVAPSGGWPNSYHHQNKILKQDDERNAIIRRVVEAAARRNLISLVFVEHKDHLKALHKMMPWAEVVYGGGDNAEVRRKLEERRTLAVIATSAWRVGVSGLPMDHLFHAGGGKASSSILQEFGRVLRKKDYGDNRCWYTDIFDCWGTYPRRHGMQRFEIMRAQEFPINITGVDLIDGMFQ